MKDEWVAITDNLLSYLDRHKKQARMLFGALSKGFLVVAFGISISLVVATFLIIKYYFS